MCNCTQKLHPVHLFDWYCNRRIFLKITIHHNLLILACKSFKYLLFWLFIVPRTWQIHQRSHQPHTLICFLLFKMACLCWPKLSRGVKLGKNALWCPKDNNSYSFIKVATFICSTAFLRGDGAWDTGIRHGNQWMPCTVQWSPPHPFFSFLRNLSYKWSHCLN